MDDRLTGLSLDRVAEQSQGSNGLAAECRPRVSRGRAGDHPAIHQLLLAVFQGPSACEFHALGDAPLYEPSDRLLIKQDGRIVSHLHLIRRRFHFGPLRLPSSEICWLATLPEYPDGGLAEQLIRCAEQQMQEDGSVAATLTTQTPEVFTRSGYQIVGRHSYSRASARDILAQIPDKKPTSLLPVEERPLNIRLWRHFELPALMRLYRERMAGLTGPLERNKPYWRWLVSRDAYDRIYVAIDGPDKMDLENSNSSIVGYAVVRGHRILELMVAPDHSAAAGHLLARACGDAIEHDYNTVEYHGPAHDPLHQLLTQAGGSYDQAESDRSSVMMARPIPDASSFVERLIPMLNQRAKDAKIQRPRELGLQVGNNKWIITIAPRSVRVSEGKLGRNYVVVHPDRFLQLLFGHFGADQGARQEWIEASTKVAQELANVMFPQVDFWRPPWDDVMAD